MTEEVKHVLFSSVTPPQQVERRCTCDGGTAQPPANGSLLFKDAKRLSAYLPQWNSWFAVHSECRLKTNKHTNKKDETE